MENMRKRHRHNKSLLLALCLLLQHYSTITPKPLPLSAPHHDPYWRQDAQQANSNINHFIEPADELNYTDYHYIGAHNAHVYPRFFSIVRQQDQTILGHLSYGVRGLMLDIYDWNLGWPSSLVGPQEAKVCLSHPQPGLIAVTQKGHLTYQSLHFELRRIVEFMRAHPQAVITIILEDYANPDQTAQEIKNVTTESAYDPLFKYADLIDNQWPTLGWMRKHNKRLIIFSQRAASTDVTFHQFDYMTENQYSTTNETTLCKNRTESPKTAPLIAFNNFSGVQLTLPTWITKKQVDHATAKRITTNCHAQCAPKRNMFNGYWANRIVDSCNHLYQNKQSTVFEYVNELNALIKKK